jgi:hypothetical protein
MSLILFSLLACGEDEPATDDSTATTDDSEVEGDDTGPFGFGISGMAYDLMNAAPSAAGLCITIADPTDAASTGDPADLIILGNTVTAEGGTFTVKGIETDSAIGVFIIVSDCADEGTVRATGTGVSVASYEDLEPGGMIEGATALSINSTFEVVLDQSAVAAGYGGDNIATAGAMMGFVQDSAGTPISGATVTGKDGVATYYGDTEPTDGLFTSAETGVNTATDAAAGGLFFVPGAPIYTYTATADGYAFEQLLFGGVPGMVTVLKFTAE